MRKFLAIAIGKLAMFFSRALKRGGGTALPGLLAQIIDRKILAKLTSNLKNGVIIITGTNGKTTTAKMLTDILSSAKMDVVTNQSGSNLSRGLVSTLIARSSLTGRRTKGDVGIFEIDEATMLEAVPKVDPKIIVVTNLFRDQLDRYGEIDKTATLIGHALEYAKGTTVVLNADDPLVAFLSKFNKNAVFYGIEDSNLNDASGFDNDNRECVECGTKLDYKARYFSHIGKYACPKCGFKRPNPENTVYKITIKPEETNISLHTSKKENADIRLNVPGLYNIYNALAASSAASFLNVTADQIKYGLENSSAAFGRMEKIQVKDKYLYLLLVKNPTGFTESVKSIVSDKTINILLALNDNFADGTDVSWIWDAEVEPLATKTNVVIASGIRALDMAVRLKYAEISPKIIQVESNLSKALEIGLDQIPAGETLFVLPTYTAMMELRNLLVKQGYATPFWE
ncbi:MAG: MurT ligase domain-containing protein [Patescibacteria group bacterium]|nr:MurT ligase domain-containing protein [Patescibacteria group bacterium]